MKIGDLNYGYYSDRHFSNIPEVKTRNETVFVSLPSENGNVIHAEAFFSIVGSPRNWSFSEMIQTKFSINMTRVDMSHPLVEQYESELDNLIHNQIEIKLETLNS